MPWVPGRIVTRPSPLPPLLPRGRVRRPAPKTGRVDEKLRRGPSGRYPHRGRGGAWVPGRQRGLISPSPLGHGSILHTALRIVFKHTRRAGGGAARPPPISLILPPPGGQCPPWPPSRRLGGTCRPVVDCLQFEDAVGPAIRYGVGDTLVCDKLHEARQVPPRPMAPCGGARSAPWSAGSRFQRISLCFSFPAKSQHDAA